MFNHSLGLSITLIVEFSYIQQNEFQYPSSPWISPHLRARASLAARPIIRPATALTVALRNVTTVETRVTLAVTVPKAPRTTRLATDVAKVATSAVTVPRVATQLAVVRADHRSAISAARLVTSLAIALMPTVATPMVVATAEAKARLAILAAAMGTCLANVSTVASATTVVKMVISPETAPKNHQAARRFATSASSLDISSRLAPMSPTKGGRLMLYGFYMVQQDGNPVH